MKKRVLTAFILAMMNVSAICNIANIPFTAQHGFSSLFYYALGAILFFIPVGLISAELATGWPQRGGVYIWVREALGDKLGFIAIWLQWIEQVIYYPAMLSFTAVTLAYVINPSLAQNKIYVTTAIFFVFWGITFLNFLGMEISGWISTLCVIIGVFIPAAIIISMGFIWIIDGHTPQITFNFSNFIPSMATRDSLSILSAILLIFGGLEMSAVHAKEVTKPQKNYPIAIALSTVIIFVILSLAALSMATVVPKENIQIASGSIEAISYFLSMYNIEKLVPIVSFLMAIGSLGMISTWLIGPSKGLLATARHGNLPPFLQKINKRNVPTTILIVQAIIVSLFSLIFLYLPTISSSYHLLFYLTAQGYLIMYILMFIAGIVLRYKKPNVKRTYKIPFKNIGMWIVCLVGTLTSLFAIIFGFFPPENSQNPYFFTTFLIIGIAIFLIIPLILHKIKKKSWHIYKKEQE